MACGLVGMEGLAYNPEEALYISHCLSCLPFLLRVLCCFLGMIGLPQACVSCNCHMIEGAGYVDLS